MTPEERDLLDRCLSDLARARPDQKDPDAAQRIDRAVRDNPDAAYVLVQHAILSDQALDDAQARIAELERQLDAQGAPRGADGGFLGGLFGGRGRDDDLRYGGASVPPTGRYDPRYDDRGQGGGSFMGGQQGGGGLGGFLRNAGMAAAGVAGGAFLFNGISNMMGGDHDRQGMFGGGDHDGERQGLFGGGGDARNDGEHDLFAGGDDSDLDSGHDSGGGDDWG